MSDITSALFDGLNDAPAAGPTPGPSAHPVSAALFDGLPESTDARQPNAFQEATANAGPSTANPVERAAGNYIRSHNIRTPEMISATYDAFRQNAAGNTTPVHAPTVQEDVQRHAAENGFFTNFGNKLGRDLAKPYEGAEGLISPETALKVREHNDLQYPSAGAGEKVGGYVSGFVNSPYAITPVGRVLSAAEAAGNSRINTAQARAKGDDIGGAEEAENAALHGALDLGQNVAANKLFGKTVGSIGKQFAPQIADAALNGEAGAVGKTLFKQLAAKVGLEAAGNDVIGRGHTLLQNAADRITTNPNQSLTEGQGVENEINAAITTGAFNLAGARGAIHEAKSAAVEHVGHEAPVLRDAAVARLFPTEYTAKPPVQQVAPEHGSQTAQPDNSGERIAPVAGAEGAHVADSGGETVAPAEGQRWEPTKPSEAELAVSRDAAGMNMPTDQHARMMEALRDEQVAHVGFAEQTLFPSVRYGREGTPEAKPAESNKNILADMRAKQGEAANEPKPTEQAAPKEESYFDRMKRRGAELQSNLKEVASDEGGGQRLTAEDLTGPGSIYHEEVKPALHSFGDFLGKGAEAFKSVFPVETGAADERTKLTFRARLAEGRQKTQSIAAEFDNARSAFGKMDDVANLDFQRRMYNKAAQPTPELQKIADAMYGHTDDGRKALEDLGHEAAADWDEKKWNMLWQKDPTKAEALLTRIGRPGKVEGKGGFLKKQTLTDFDEGLARGLVPKFPNPVEQFMAATAERTKYIAGVRAMKDLVDVGSITRIGPNDDIPKGWSEVPDGAKGPLNGILKKDVVGAPKQGANGRVLETKVGRLIAPDAVNRILYNQVTPSLFSKGFAGSMYRALQGFNNQATSFLLGMSGYHVTKVAKESMLLKTAQAFDLAAKGEAGEGAKDAAGAVPDLVRNIAKGKAIQEQLLGQRSATPEEARRNAAMIQGGFSAKADDVYETKIRRRFSKALQDGGVQGMIRAAAYSPLALNEHVSQEGVFKYVQHAKLAIGGSMTEDFLRQNPNASTTEIRKQVGKISDHLDNVLGLMERDNMFWNRTMRDVATLSTLSVGWNYGSLRELAGGVADVGKGIGTLVKGGKVSDIDTRRISYLMTMATTQAAIGAVTTYLMTGKGPQELKDYVFPKSGNTDRDGHDVRYNPGLYTSDYYDFLTHPLDTAAAKASPLIHAATDLLRNQDYKRNPIYDAHDPTDTLHHRMAADIAKYLATTNSPMTFQQIHNTITEGGSAAKSTTEKLLPWLGVKHAPKSASQTPAEELAYTLLSEKRGTGGRTQEQEQTHKQDMGWVDMLRAGQTEQAKAQMRKDPNMSPTRAKEIFSRSKQLPGIAGMVGDTQFGPDDLSHLWAAAGDEEQAAMRGPLLARIGKVRPTTPFETAKWRQLRETVKATAGE